MTHARLFTSESVTEGHPDKLADQISDAILDEILSKDPLGRVACETVLSTGLAVVVGEITTDCYVDMAKVVRNTIKGAGYTRAHFGIDWETCGVLVSVDEQSPDIAQGVNIGGAGDQGMMFGFACDETPELMPAPIQYAHNITRRLAQVRKDGTLKYLRPDGKSQVTVEYGEDGLVKRIATIVVSAQHSEEVEQNRIADVIRDPVLLDLLAVLGADDDGGDALDQAVLAVFDGDLALAVGAEVLESAVLADLGQPAGDVVGVLDRRRHQLRGLVAGEAEHHALVTGAPDVDALGDVWRLLVDADEHTTGLPVDAEMSPRVAGAFDCVADDLGHVDIAIGGDLTDNDRQASGQDRLAGHPAEGVLGQDLVEDGVRDLIGEFVGVAFGDRLRGEKTRMRHTVPPIPAGNHGAALACRFLLPRAVSVVPRILLDDGSRGERGRDQFLSLIH